MLIRHPLTCFQLIVAARKLMTIPCQVARQVHLVTDLAKFRENLLTELMRFRKACGSSLLSRVLKIK